MAEERPHLAQSPLIAFYPFLADTALLFLGFPARGTRPSRGNTPRRLQPCGVGSRHPRSRGQHGGDRLRVERTPALVQEAPSG
jgi:hypothetical protein